MNQLTRRVTWYAHLTGYLDSIRQTPWDDVTHNCAMFVGGAIAVMTDTDPMKELGMPRPESSVDVARILIEYDGVSGIMTRLLGEPISPLLARRGDIVLKDGETGDTLGIITGSKATFLSKDGLQSRSLGECRRAWRVG